MFSVHKLEKNSSNTGKVYFKGLVNLLRYIRYNKTLVLKNYAKIEDGPKYDLLIQAIINYYKQLMVFSGSSCRDCTYTGRSTSCYIVFHQG